MIFLIGMSRAGKTETAKALASKICRNFFDTDDELIKKYNQNIPSLYKKLGEANFRKAELDILKEIVEKQKNTNCIISTGGGIIENTEAIIFLKQFKNIILIDTNPEIIFKRIQNEAKTGKGYPKFLGENLTDEQAKEKFYQIYKHRMKIYKMLATKIQNPQFF